MRLLKTAVLFCLLAAVSACSFSSFSEKMTKSKKESWQSTGSPFVSAEGTRFIRYGKPYYFVGANFWYGAYLGSTDEGRERLRKELDQLKSLGVDNLRVLVVSEQTELMRAVRPAYQIQSGQDNESLLVGLDHLLVEMAKRNMVAVLYLKNHWQWSGGMLQPISRATGEAVFNRDLTGDWNGFMQNSAQFYLSEKAQEWYRNTISMLVTRTNSVNGVVYREDPTIMSWQLANELGPANEEGGRTLHEPYKDWIRTTAQYIKSLDENHLVSTGSEGAMGTLRDIALYQDAHNIPEVDYLTFHMWPKNWGWFDVKQSELTYANAIASSKAYILQHMQVAKELNKPIVLEKFGIERDNGDYRLTAGTIQRDRFFKEIFEMLETQVKLGSPFAGSNFWAWGGLGRSQSEDFIWRAGDPFTGDPPHELQGLNSVFSGDASTLKLIKNHAQFLRARP